MLSVLAPFPYNPPMHVTICIMNHECMNIDRAYPKLHGFLDVFEHLGDVGKTRRVDVGAVVTAHNPSAPTTLLCSLSASDNGTLEEGKNWIVKFLMVWDMSCNDI